jgi:catechol 2,3-dioxygenase-like lactoylglutathione lyase family enzyme
MKSVLAAGIALTLTVQAPVARPRILGIAHLAVFVSDLTAARGFYRDLLGFDESFTLPKPDGSVDVAFVKISDHQWIELINRPTGGEGQLDHVALSTDGAERMRDYLASRGVQVPEKVGVGPTGDKSFTITDPDGHRVEILEYQRDSRTGKDAGTHLPATRIAERALHVGILVGELARATEFYTGILGFEEFWRGSAAKSATLSWVNMKVPDGTDYLEFMLYDQKPPPDRRGTQHHLCLLVPDAEKAVAALESRPARKAYTRAIEVRTGINRKRQVNLFDPDGTRVELMEPDTVDGKPAPASTLPPPR